MNLNHYQLIILISLVLFSEIVIADTINVTDIEGNIITVPENISRVISVDPFSSQFIHIIGADNKLVGTPIGPSNVSLVKTYEPYIANSPTFGSKNSVNLTVIKSLNPDIVIADKSYNKTISKLEELNIPVLQIDVENPDNLLKSYEIIGNILGKDNETSKFLAYYNSKMDLIKEGVVSLTDKDRKKIYFGQTDPLQTLGNDYYEAKIAKIAGGDNVAVGYSGGDNKVTVDNVYKWNPDLIVLFSYSSINVDDLFVDSAWQSLPALRSRNIFRMPKFIMSWELPVPESILGALWLQNIMYPNRVTYNLTNEIKEFYASFYNVNLTDSDINNILYDKTMSHHSDMI
ncbi:ABC transporter substrate-binding protein [uncultured Methanospirillum sp.]|uniref:ABC transporter substrate-binding protein n=1 Tax=uncultured Methanospirillum sp. TaxID=262503 RepID=UPI0029C9A886|nr:ABC transporter substrate-binding protein [uncultured Methanospirillum sp.]